MKIFIISVAIVAAIADRVAAILVKKLEKSPLAWYLELCREIEIALCRKDG